MTHLAYYEAPRRFTLDAFVDPVDLPHAIRAVTPPNAKSSHALAGAICRSLGAVNDVYTKTTGSTLMLSSAAAWSLATGVTDIYLAAAEDLTRVAIYECIEFAGQIGANLHLVFSHGQVHVHGATLNEVGFNSTPFAHLPNALTQSPAPSTHSDESSQFEDDNWAAADLPQDHWMTFRATYLATLPADLAQRSDDIYLDAYTTARHSGARTVDEVAALAGHLWERLGTGTHERLITCRAIQAALFRNGLLVRLDMHHFTRHVQLNYVNLMTPSHYTLLRGYLNPWRAAATVLHAHHVSTEESLALKASHVTPDGTIPSLDIDFPPEARVLLAAQRWHQLLTQDANPPLFKEKPTALRTGIRTVTHQLNLPLVPYWRTLTTDKGRGNIGIKIEEFA